MSNRSQLQNQFVVFLIVGLLVPTFGAAQENSAPPKDTKPADAHWDEIDASQLALVERLVKVEASLDSLTALIAQAHSKPDKSPTAAPADGKNPVHESDARSGEQVAVPMKWTDFYRQLAEKFYTHSRDREPFHFTRTALQNVSNSHDDKAAGAPIPSIPADAGEAPPHENDYLQLYNNSKALADAEFKELPIAERLLRKQTLEDEQCAIWCQIAYRTISARDLANKTLYRFQPYVPAIGLKNVQRTTAMTAGVLFLRTSVETAAAAEHDQSKTFESFQHTIADARNQLNECWSKAISKEELQEPNTTVAKITALAKQLDDVAGNCSNNYKTAIDRATSNDGPRKSTARAALQNSLLRYVEITFALDELLNSLAADWQIKSDKFSPLLVTKAGEQPPAPRPVNLSLANQLAQSVAAYRAAISRNPSNAQAHKSLAIALVKQAEALGQDPPWDDAADEFATAVDLLPDNTSTISPRKTACRELAQWDELFNHVVQIRPDDTSLWIGRAEYQVQHSQWKEALSELTKIIQNRPLHDDSFEYACLLVWLGDNAAYEKFCRELAGRAGQPQDEFAAFIMARVCALGPCKAVDRETVLGWVEKTGVTEAAAYRLHVLGLAYYRAGKYEQAIQYLEKSNANNWTDPARSMNWLVLAMAYHQLHNVDQSEQSLKTAHDLIALAAPKQPGGPVDLFAPDWIEYQVLSREADALLHASPKDSKTRATDN